jgi:hypothetical protein
MRDGTLRHAIGLPMSRSDIASQLHITENLLNETIDVCTKDQNINDSHHRIEIWGDGTIQITNWNEYQSVPEDKRKLTDPREIELSQRLQTRKLSEKFPTEAISTEAARKAIEKQLEPDNLEKEIEMKQVSCICPSCRTIRKELLEVKFINDPATIKKNERIELLCNSCRKQ